MAKVHNTTMSRKQNRRHWSDFDFSGLTWKKVFDEADIQDDDPSALK